MSRSLWRSDGFVGNEVRESRSCYDRYSSQATANATLPTFHPPRHPRHPPVAFSPSIRPKHSHTDHPSSCILSDPSTKQRPYSFDTRPGQRLLYTFFRILDSCTKSSFTSPSLRSRSRILPIFTEFLPLPDARDSPPSKQSHPSDSICPTPPAAIQLVPSKHFALSHALSCSSTRRC
jgi:hypothetical protein